MIGILDIKINETDLHDQEKETMTESTVRNENPPNPSTDPRPQTVSVLYCVETG